MQEQGTAPDTTSTNAKETHIPEQYKNVRFKFPFDPDEVVMHEAHYNNGRLCIRLVTVPDAEGFSEPFATLTVNLVDQELRDGEFFVKAYSENMPLISPLLASGVFVEIHGRAETTWKFAKGRIVKFENGEAFEDEIVRAGEDSKTLECMPAKNVPLGVLAWKLEQLGVGADERFHLGRRLQEAPICPYCQAVSEIVSGDVVYPHRDDLANKQFWRCLPCDAYVGCHPGTPEPLGTLANGPLRMARGKAHAVFDPRWRSGQLKRSAAYKQLAEHLGIDGEACHIGMFDLETCEKVIEFAAASVAP